MMDFHPRKRIPFSMASKYDMPKPPEEDIYILPDEYTYLSRSKRAVMFKSQRNEKLNVETLVVVDRKMVQNHGNENITTYVLTILNMVSALFKDGTIGGNINIAIVGLVLLEDDQLVGCDRVLGSSAMPDVCGVCKGNNSTCKMFKGQYNKQHYTNQYHSVVTIPAGARSIRVYEMNSSSSYLSVRNSYHKYYLNGYWTVDWPGRHTFSGTVFNYKRPYSQPESLTATGPTNETLVVEILLQGRNPGVSWEYALPKSDGDKKMVPKHNYTWAIVRSECSVSCGGGQMTTKAACYRDLRMQVNISFCNPKSQPVTGLVSCNTQACPPSWSVGNWGECSHSCGIGEQIRQVLCTQKVYYNKMETVTDTKCTQPVPLRRQTCNPHSCPPAWSAGPWSECSRKCGKGLKKRTVVCKSTNPIPRAQILPDSSCLAEPKPKPQESCMVKRCQKNRKLQWFVSIWTGCSVTCGKGIQKRLLNCAEKDVAGKYKQLAPKRCHHVQKPAVQLERECTLAACPRLVTHTVTSSARAGWYSSPWSQCTVTCGGGVQARSVQCIAHGKPSSGCLLHQKPVMSQACNTNFCPEPEKKDEAGKYSGCFLCVKEPAENILGIGLDDSVMM
ncbi:A disintegrin and metalloproteinase with thrombospondin motifs 16 [Acipenser ruthenus]|uniref:A disintegrin and metalloproteinase with thrombospondin motifs 16 n=1 Tax=Acipenser ruthenus TaxID=7906 RepID=A0A662Z1V0_ACIRT|nr:A disintegrin and metalloproteinase with thrombospondin motifs 16 [Acipenser ruthenus]